MNRRRPQYSEEQIAEQVVLWLQDLHWTVYQEVQIHKSRVADIVATQGPLLWVVETKVVFGLNAIEQAHRWLGQANYVSIGVPWFADRSGFKALLLKHLGIGLLTASQPLMNVSEVWQIEEKVKPSLNRRPWQGLRKTLCPEHQTWAKAGNARSERYSPFKATSRSVADFVRQHPGVTFKEMLAQVSTHYQSSATARSSLKYWIERGKVPGVRLQQDGRLLKLYPVEVL